jgi:hypothetical protein
MIFLIEYKRDEGRIVTFKSFEDSERGEAQESRLELELDLNKRGVDREVVLLGAASEAAIRLTHARYFKSLEELVSKIRTCVLLTSF